VSLVPFPDGTVGRFPHIIERNKPGIIGVLANGQRFCNEGMGYHDYVVAMLRSVPPKQEVASWLICTRAFQRRYGLGIARPTPLPVGRQSGDRRQRSCAGRGWKANSGPLCGRHGHGERHGRATTLPAGSISARR
jgi:hypothetical protein